MISGYATPRNSTIVLSSILTALLRTYFKAVSRLLPGVAVRHAEQRFTLPPRYAGRRTQPVDARRDTVVAGGRSLAVWRAGPAAAPAVLLVHGWGGRALQMGGFVAPQLERGFRVVWFDQPGHGESAPGAVALPDMVRAVEALATTHGPFTAAIGHSLGAAALGLALRGGLALGRVVFVSPPASMHEHARNFARLLGFTPRVREAMRRRFERRYGVRFADIDHSEELEQLRLPALFVHDRDDREVPFEHTLRLSARIPAARLLRTWGLGHRRILRDRDIVRAAVDFVSGRDDALPAELPLLPLPAALY